jgi:SAM-dependent methyltransferase
MTSVQTTDGNFRLAPPSKPLEFTGERMTSAIEGQIEHERLHRYCLARDLCLGLDVLDVASGEGYGSAILAGVARSVVGVDIDEGSVAHAREAYHLENLRFLQGSAIELPVENASVDAVVSFETSNTSESTTGSQTRSGGCCGLAEYSSSAPPTARSIPRAESISTSTICLN